MVASVRMPVGAIKYWDHHGKLAATSPPASRQGWDPLIGQQPYHRHAQPVGSPLRGHRHGHARQHHDDLRDAQLHTPSMLQPKQEVVHGVAEIKSSQDSDRHDQGRLTQASSDPMKLPSIARLSVQQPDVKEAHATSGRPPSSCTPRFVGLSRSEEKACSSPVTAQREKPSCAQGPSSCQDSAEDSDSSSSLSIGSKRSTVSRYSIDFLLAPDCKPKESPTPFAAPLVPSSASSRPPSMEPPFPTSGRHEPDRSEISLRRNPGNERLPYATTFAGPYHLFEQASVVGATSIKSPSNAHSSPETTTTPQYTPPMSLSNMLGRGSTTHSPSSPDRAYAQEPSTQNALHLELCSRASDQRPLCGRKRARSPSTSAPCDLGVEFHGPSPPSVMRRSSSESQPHGVRSSASSPTSEQSFQSNMSLYASVAGGSGTNKARRVAASMPTPKANHFGPVHSQNGCLHCSGAECVPPPRGRDEPLTPDDIAFCFEQMYAWFRALVPRNGQTQYELLEVACGLDKDPRRLYLAPGNLVRAGIDELSRSIVQWLRGGGKQRLDDRTKFATRDQKVIMIEKIWQLYKGLESPGGGGANTPDWRGMARTLNLAMGKDQGSKTGNERLRQMMDQRIKHVLRELRRSD